MLYLLESFDAAVSVFSSFDSFDDFFDYVEKSARHEGKLGPCSPFYEEMLLETLMSSLGYEGIDDAVNCGDVEMAELLRSCDSGCIVSRSIYRGWTCSGINPHIEAMRWLMENRRYVLFIDNDHDLLRLYGNVFALRFLGPGVTELIKSAVEGLRSSLSETLEVASEAT